jgi:hypothetical protein
LARGGKSAPASALLDGLQIADDGAGVTRGLSGRKHSISARHRRKLGSSEVSPDGSDALRFVQVRAKLLFGVKVPPTAAALELTDMSKPPLREGMPFRGNLVEADPALHNRH